MACPGDQFAEKVSQNQLSNTKDFMDELVCKICFNVVGCNPKLTKCSHLFCGDCLEHWFASHPGNQTWAQRAKTAGAVPCPICKTLLQKQEDVFPLKKDGKCSSGLLWRMVGGLSVQCCKAHDGGICSWNGAYSAYSEHLHGGTCGHSVDKEAEECTDSDSASTACKSVGERGFDAIPGMESAADSDTESHSRFLLEHARGLPNVQALAKAESEVPSTPSTRSDSQKDDDEQEDDEQEDASVRSEQPQPELVEDASVRSEQQPELVEEGQDLNSLLKSWVELKVEDSKSNPSKVVAEADVALTSPIASRTLPNKAGNDELPKPSAATDPMKSVQKIKDGSTVKQNSSAGAEARSMAVAQAHAYRAQLAQWHAAHAHAARMVQWNAAHTQVAMARQYQAAQMQMAAAMHAGYTNGQSGSR